MERVEVWGIFLETKKSSNLLGCYHYIPGRWGAGVFLHKKFLFHMLRERNYIYFTNILTKSIYLKTPSVPLEI